MSSIEALVRNPHLLVERHLDASGNVPIFDLEQCGRTQLFFCYVLRSFLVLSVCLSLCLSFSLRWTSVLLSIVLSMFLCLLFFEVVLLSLLLK